LSGVVADGVGVRRALVCGDTCTAPCIFCSSSGFCGSTGPTSCRYWPATSNASPISAQSPAFDTSALTTTPWAMNINLPQAQVPGVGNAGAPHAGGARAPPLEAAVAAALLEFNAQAAIEAENHLARQNRPA
jgi:hypothetical protein